MPEPDDTIESLREALSHSPDNVPLRRHLARALAERGRHDEASRELREALSHAPDDDELKLELGRAFFESGKSSAAYVVVEDLIKTSSFPAAAYVLHARMLLQDGDPERAAREYRKALDADPDVADDRLSKRLGVRTEADEDASESFEIEDGRTRMFAEEGAPEGPANLEMERPDTGFGDVGGMEKVKEEVRMKIIHPLTHPEIYEAYGKKVGGGILMYGPPGCGKTHLARATAGEVEAGFISIGIHDVLDMWVGQSERKLHDLFEYARKNRPCVLFFDEVDALGANRSDMRQSAGRHLINQFLAELDGISEGANDGVLVLAATNAPWHLDSAFRRPGRFDRIIFVPPPDDAARASILDILLRDKPAQGIDPRQVAKKCAGFSGADLKNLIDIAIEGKLKDAMKAGVPEPLTTKDLVKAAKRTNPTTKEWFSTARNYAVYSNQGGFYDDIIEYLDLR